MFLRMNPDRDDVTLKRLKANGVDLDGPSETMESGVRLTDFVRSGDTLTTAAVVAVRKHCLQVVLNPELPEILGYTPAYPQILYPGHWGNVSVRAGLTQDASPEVWDSIDGLEWLVALHFVPVTMLAE